MVAALHDEVKMASSMAQRRLPAALDSVIAEKRGDVQFGLVGSLERNARKLGASGPPPLPLEQSVSGTSGWLGGVPLRGALVAQNKMDF